MTAAVYQKITNDILAAMDRDGMPPWVKPWSSVKTTRLWEPVNGRTGRHYRSINVLVLAEACQEFGYPVNEWWTLRQVAEVGGSIKAGERGQTVIFSKPVLIDPEGNIAPDDAPARDGNGDLLDDWSQRFWAVAYTVFNHAQCEGLPEPRSTPHPLGSALPGKPRAEALIQGNTHLPPIKWDGGNKAYFTYGFRADGIHMPARASFHGVDEYYSVLFHECTHSTGHPKRLNRPSLVDAVKFGDVSYAKEELVAEMGAAFLCAMTGIENTQVRLNTVAYLKGWRDRIAKDPRLIVTAASLAQASTDFILAGAKVKPAMPAEEADQPEATPEPTQPAAPKPKGGTKSTAKGKPKAKAKTPKASAKGSRRSSSTAADPEAVALQFLNGHTLPPAKDITTQLRRSQPYPLKEAGWWSDGAVLVSLDALKAGTTWGRSLPARLTKIPARRDARTMEMTPLLANLGDIIPGVVIETTGSAETYGPKQSIPTVTLAIPGQAPGTGPTYNRALVSLLLALCPSSFGVNARRLLIAKDAHGKVVGLLGPILQGDTKTNPGPTEMVGLGRFVRAIVRLPDGRRAALTPTGSPCLAWEPSRKRLAVLYPDDKAPGESLSLTGSTASRHAHFHGAAPTAGISMVDPGPIGPEWRKVGLLESVTYHRGDITSPARGDVAWLHQFGDRGEGGHGAADLEAPSAFSERLMPILLVNAAGQVAIQRRSGNRYAVRDWIVG